MAFDFRSLYTPYNTPELGQFQVAPSAVVAPPNTSVPAPQGIVPTTNSAGLYSLYNRPNPYAGEAEIYMKAAQQPSSGINFAGPIAAYMAGKAMKKERLWKEDREKKIGEYEKRLEAGEEKANQRAEFQYANTVWKQAMELAVPAWEQSMDQSGDANVASQAAGDVISQYFAQAGIEVPADWQMRFNPIEKGKLGWYVKPGGGAPVQGTATTSGRFIVHTGKDGKQVVLRDFMEFGEYLDKRKTDIDFLKASGSGSDAKGETYFKTDKAGKPVGQWTFFGPDAQKQAYMAGYQGRLADKGDEGKEVIPTIMPNGYAVDPKDPSRVMWKGEDGQWHSNKPVDAQVPPQGEVPQAEDKGPKMGLMRSFEENRAIKELQKTGALSTDPEIRKVQERVISKERGGPSRDKRGIIRSLLSPFAEKMAVQNWERSGGKFDSDPRVRAIQERLLKDGLISQ